MPRILDILDKYSIKATFFTPGHSAKLFQDVVQEAHRRGHEIAAHSMYHQPSEVSLAMSGVEPASPDQQRVYLEQQIKLLEKTVGERPIGFRSPIGDWLGEHVPQHLSLSRRKFSRHIYAKPEEYRRNLQPLIAGSPLNFMQ